MKTLVFLIIYFVSSQALANTECSILFESPSNKSAIQTLLRKRTLNPLLRTRDRGFGTTLGGRGSNSNSSISIPETEKTKALRTQTNVAKAILGDKLDSLYFDFLEQLVAKAERPNEMIVSYISRRVAPETATIELTIDHNWVLQVHKYSRMTEEKLVEHARNWFVGKVTKNNDIICALALDYYYSRVDANVRKEIQVQIYGPNRVPEDQMLDEAKAILLRFYNLGYSKDDFNYAFQWWYHYVVEVKS